MALEGTLRDFSLADIFQLIGIQKKTGVLTLKNRDEVVTVSFLNGDVVSADSLHKNLEDRLGNVLVKSGRISESRLQEALAVQKATLQRLGYILVHDGYISEEVLREALCLQITQIVYRLFRWNDGDYHFSQTESVEYDREHFTPVSAENILMEGIRMIDEWPIIERKIKSFDMIFRKAHPDAQPVVISDEEEAAGGLDAAFSDMGQHEEKRRGNEGLRLAREELAVYNLVDGTHNVQEIVDRARMGEFECCRILYDLLSRNLITSSGAVTTAPAAPRRFRIAPLLEKAGYAALAAIVAVSLLTVGGSPLSGTPVALAPSGAVDKIMDLVARNRMDRIDEAVQIYYLQKGFFPDDLRDLVQGRLMPESALHDPWGRSFGFISTPDGYRIIAYEEGGAENESRTIVHRIHKLPVEAAPDGGAPAAHLLPPAEGSSSR